MASIKAIIAILIAFVGIIISIYFLSNEFKIHFIQNWPNLTINFLLVLLGASIAIVGISWAFQNESNRIFYNQLEIFKRSFPAVTEETAGNQSLIKSLKETISTSGAGVKRISTDISENLLTNPMLYKYVGQEYLYAIGIYLQRARETNRMLDQISDAFKQDKNISDHSITAIHQKLDDLLYYLYILQYQSQYYVYLYGDEGQLRPGNQKQIMRWLLKEEDISSDGIIQKLDELVNISREDKEKLLKSTLDTWKRVRER